MISIMKLKRTEIGDVGIRGLGSDGNGNAICETQNV